MERFFERASAILKRIYPDKSELRPFQGSFDEAIAPTGSFCSELGTLYLVWWTRVVDRFYMAQFSHDRLENDRFVQPIVLIRSVACIYVQVCRDDTVIRITKGKGSPKLLKGGTLSYALTQIIGCPVYLIGGVGFSLGVTAKRLATLVRSRNCEP